MGWKKDGLKMRWTPEPKVVPRDVTGGPVRFLCDWEIWKDEHAGDSNMQSIKQWLSIGIVDKTSLNPNECLIKLERWQPTRNTLSQCDIQKWKPCRNLVEWFKEDAIPYMSLAGQGMSTTTSNANHFLKAVIVKSYSIVWSCPWRTPLT